MKTRFSIFAVIILALVTFGCSKGQDKTVAATVKLNMTKSYLGVEGSTFWVYVNGEGAWRLALDFSNSKEEEAADAWAEFVDPADGEGIAQRRVKYSKNEGDFGRQLEIILYGADGKEADRYAIMQKTSHYTPDPVPAWLELPAQKSGLEYHNQTYHYNSKVQRNYSYGWNKNYYLSEWVAYPLYKPIPSGTRKDVWAFDSKVDVQYQANCVNYSYWGAYDRGHQIPSADRRQPKEAQDQTCLMTNLTPQSSRFNQGVWGKFEAQVRTWATMADTLYVVTGCKVSPGYSTTNDSDGKACPIPSHYFKVLLARGGGFNGIPAADTKWLAAAFLLNHDSDLPDDISVVKASMMKVSTLESLLGFDFYTNLASVVGESVASTIENDDPSKREFWFK